MKTINQKKQETMTPEQINEKIANIVGADDRWVICKRGMYYRPNASGYTSSLSDAWILPHDKAVEHEYLRGDEPVTIRRAPAENYCGDLNAMAEAEEFLDAVKNGWMWYAELLEQVCGTDGWGIMSQIDKRRIIHSTAIQKAEAFLRALDQWDD